MHRINASNLDLITYREVERLVEEQDVTKSVVASAALRMAMENPEQFQSYLDENKARYEEHRAHTRKVFNPKF